MKKHLLIVISSFESLTVFHIITSLWNHNYHNYEDLRIYDLQSADNAIKSNAILLSNTNKNMNVEATIIEQWNGNGLLKMFSSWLSHLGKAFTARHNFWLVTPNSETPS